jgi:hypothetical protein
MALEREETRGAQRVAQSLRHYDPSKDSDLPEPGVVDNRESIFKVPLLFPLTLPPLRQADTYTYTYTLL